jgi:MoaA/NifB/PqqE/SkfB family radical SAM enzyme
MITKQKVHRLVNKVSKHIGLPAAPGYPSALMVEPTNYCNLSCTLCPTGSKWLAHPQGRMNVEAFYRVMDEVGPFLDRVAFWNWGEPFLHPRLLDMFRYTRRFPVWMQVCTNGHFFNDRAFVKDMVKSGVNQVIVSVDGITSESVQKYRGPAAKLESIIHGIQNMISVREEFSGRGPQIEMQFLVMQHNQGEIDEVSKLAESLPVDRFFLKTINMRREDLETHASLLPDHEKFRRFEQDQQGQWRVKGHPTGICPYIYDTAVILWDGSLLPCCFDAEEKIVLGNAFNGSFYKAWTSPTYNRFRYRVRHHRTDIPMCSWCPEERQLKKQRLNRFWTDLS